MSNEMVKSESNGSIVKGGMYAFDTLEKMAGVLAKSKMFGAWDTQEKVLALLLISQTEGGNPCTAVQRYFPITNAQGQTSTGKWAKAMLIDFQARGGDIEWLVTNSQEAKATFTMANRKPFTLSYTWAQAVRAKLTGKSNWSNHPDDMLRNTVIAKGLRVFDPASTSFMYSESEGVDTAEPFINTPTVTGEPFTKPEGEKPQELFGSKPKAGRPKKVEEKVVEGTIVEETKVVTEEPKQAPVTTPITEAVKEATIQEKAVEPKVAEKPIETAPVAEESEFSKKIKTLDQIKLRGVLYGLKYIKSGEPFTVVTKVRQDGILKQWDAFKKKVENYEAFGTEVK